MAFIPIEKMKQLREAAKNGDERARQILIAQMKGDDYSSSLEEYFKPAQEEPVVEATATDPKQNAIGQKSKLQEFLDYNGVKEGDADYNDVVESFYQEYPNLRPKEDGQEQEPSQEENKPGLFDELGDAVKELLSVCDRAIIAVADDNENDITGATLKGTLSTLQEIKQATLDAFAKIKDLKASMNKKVEEIEENQL